jgi:hypothetical protein
MAKSVIDNQFQIMFFCNFAKPSISATSNKDYSPFHSKTLVSE